MCPKLSNDDHRIDEVGKNGPDLATGPGVSGDLVVSGSGWSELQTDSVDAVQRCLVDPQDMPQMRAAAPTMRLYHCARADLGGHAVGGLPVDAHQDRIWP